MERLVTEFSTWEMDGVKFVTQTPAVAATVQSKRATYLTLAGVVPVPEIYDSSVPHYPAYAKLIAGSGGRGNMIINNKDDLQWARAKGLLVTEYLPGGEIVAYNLSDLEGTHLLCITKTMGRWRGGASQLGALKDDPVVRGYAKAISGKMKLIGPWFAQFKGDGKGTYKLMEVNARPGGGSGITRLAGVNMPLLTTKIFAGQSIEIPKLANNLSWVRNLQPYPTTGPFDLVLWSLSVFIRTTDGNLRSQAVAALFELANQQITQACYGTCNQKALSAWNLYNHFSQRYKTLDDALRSVRRPSRTICITNDHSEQLNINKIAPQVRVLSSGALDVLGKEKM
jgi:hypothetical protein